TLPSANSAVTGLSQVLKLGPDILLRIDSSAASHREVMSSYTGLSEKPDGSSFSPVLDPASAALPGESTSNSCSTVQAYNRASLSSVSRSGRQSPFSYFDTAWWVTPSCSAS